MDIEIDMTKYIQEKTKKYGPIRITRVGDCTLVLFFWMIVYGRAGNLRRLLGITWGHSDEPTPNEA